MSIEGLLNYELDMLQTVMPCIGFEPHHEKTNNVVIEQVT